jgi:hypothetical protein
MYPSRAREEKGISIHVSISYERREGHLNACIHLVREKRREGHLYTCIHPVCEPADISEAERRTSQYMYRRDALLFSSLTQCVSRQTSARRRVTQRRVCVYPCSEKGGRRESGRASALPEARESGERKRAAEHQRGSVSRDSGA